ncbi:MAG: fibrobacter succinogenes major paralogous domain-containing protein [Flavobacteriales bacterium]|nr:fibrobacter succinogenes major paralogous domain-containing protein [Flavobacteriales bacterium]
MKNVIYYVVAAALLVSCGSTVKTVKIGAQKWTIENLNTTTFRNGDKIMEASNIYDWEKATKERIPAYCHYYYDTTYAKKYGKLYNWFAINDPRGLAPKGFHIPSDKEFTDLIAYLGNDSAGYKLKNINGWEDGGNGSNATGFGALPGGGCGIDGVFGMLGTHGAFWSNTDVGADFAWYYLVGSEFIVLHRMHNYKWVGLSVRCIKDK